MIQKFKLFDFYNFKKWKKLSLSLLFFVLLILIYLTILGFVIINFGSKENTNYNLDNSSSQFDTKFDTIIVLGAGLIDNSVSPVLAARIDHALDLYQKGVAKSIIFTGGIGSGQNISEGEASFNYAFEKWQSSQINFQNWQTNTENSSQNLELKQEQNTQANLKPNFFFETKSKTTKENLSEAKQIMKENKLETAIIVSDPLHLFRTNQIANLLQMKVQTSPTPYSRYQSWQSKSGFLFRELFFCQVFWLTGS